MATVTGPGGETFEAEGMALEYYRREPGFEIGVTLPAEAVEIVDANVADVLRAVGDDPQLAAQALAAEQSRDAGPRKTLVERLTAIASAGADDPDATQ